MTGFINIFIILWMEQALNQLNSVFLILDHFFGDLFYVFTSTFHIQTLIFDSNMYKI